MKNKIIRIIFFFLLTGLIIWTFFYLQKHTSVRNKQAVVYSTAQQELISRKKELMLKEYDSLFAVYDRETSIIYNLKGWGIALIILCLTIAFSAKSVNIKYIHTAFVLMLGIFYILEVSERSAMLNLLQELRNLETIFSIENTAEFNTAVVNYGFRDLRNMQLPLLNWGVVKAMVDPRILWWYFGLLSFYFLSIKNVPQAA